MAGDVTDRLALPLLNAGQAQKEIFHNEALLTLDFLVRSQVESATVMTPPASPVAGQCWIVPASGAAGAWSGQGNKIACWNASGWRFVAPAPGMAFHVGDEAQERAWTGSAWAAGAVRADGIYIGGTRVVGARQGAIADATGGTTADLQARAAISAILSALRAHGLIAP
jgi:Protein of unknown function (DUF2793)